RYKPQKPVSKDPIRVSPHAGPAGRVCLALIGAGSYAQGYLLPNLPSKDHEIVRKAVLSNNGAASKRVAEKYEFQLSVSEQNDIFEDPEINTVFITTRHDSHADYTLRALNSQKNVFVEKPLALTAEQLDKVVETYRMLGSSPSRHQPALMVGYNRRFSRLAAALKQEVGDGPMSMLYRVNAGRVPVDSWIHDVELGGGRIIG